MVAARSNALTLSADDMLLGDHAPLEAFAVWMIPIAEAPLDAADARPDR